MKTKYRIRKRYVKRHIQNPQCESVYYQPKYMPQQLVKILWWKYYEDMCPGKGFLSEQDARNIIISHSASTPKPKTEYIYIP